ncbi:hypothetical protein [Ectobacillus funiculus]
MPMKKLFIFIMVFGLGAKYLQEVHGIDWYVDKNPTTQELTIGWIIGISGLVAGLTFIAKILGFGEGKEQEEYYYDDEGYQEEEDAEIYQQEVKITWWNDWYD